MHIFNIHFLANYLTIILSRETILLMNLIVLIHIFQGKKYIKRHRLDAIKAQI